MRRYHHFKSIALGFAISLSLLACGGGDGAPAPESPPVGGGGGPGGGAPVDPAPVVTTAALRTEVPLMKGWRFVQDDSLTDAQALASAGTNWAEVTLPHTWNATDAATTAQSSPSTIDYKRGLGWYRLEFQNIESATRWLQFEGASLTADVWLNGTKLGQHKGAFTTFRFDASMALKSGKNVLLVKTDNRNSGSTAVAPISGDFNVAGGLYRGVALIGTRSGAHIALDDAGSSGVAAHSTDVTAANATVKVRTFLKNVGEATGTYTVVASLLEADGSVKASAASEAITLDSGAAATATHTISVAKPHLWHGVADPYLYDMVVELRDASGKAVDKVVQKFGIRDMRFDPAQGFILNGQKISLRGVNMHQDMLGKAWAVSQEDIDQSFAFIREVGANTVRLAHYPHSSYTLQQADKFGLVVWAELPVVNSVGSATPETTGFAENARMQLREMIRQQYNHASVGMWSIANEVASPAAAVVPTLKMLHEFAKAEDPSRNTTLAHEVTRSGDVVLPSAIPQVGVTDMYAVNRYFQWYYGTSETQFGEELDKLHADNPGVPIGVGEYGAGSGITHHSDNVLGGRVCSRDSSGARRICYQAEEYANYVHERDYAQIAARPYLFGTWIWNMFDFGSGNRHEGDIGQTNTKGIVTFGRDVKKDVFFYYKANWSTAPVTYITGRRYTNRAYAVTDVKVYSNAAFTTLLVNDVTVATKNAAECPMKVCEFKNVNLQAGNNAVVAKGTHAGETVTDLVNWNLAASKIDNVFIATGQLHTGFTSTGDPLLGNRTFGSDNFFVGGELPVASGFSGVGLPANQVIQNIGTAGTTPPETGRVWEQWREGTAFAYRIPVPNGTYQVRLGFLEPTATAAGARKFNVAAEGVTQVTDMDVFQSAGARYAAIVRTFNVTVADGVLNLDFSASVGKAIISNISVIKQ